MQDNRQLLCTFAETKTFKEIVKDIRKFYMIPNAKFFVFSNTKVPNEIYITYNVIPEQGRELSKFPNTISIHRKKQTNTLYSLNALNVLVKEENGKPDKNFIIDWNLYKNSLVISGEVSVRIISLKIVDVIHILGSKEAPIPLG